MRFPLTILLSVTVLWTNAQTGYPQGYFRNPLDIPISLSGNFGELRPNHYHMGIDLKTNQRENLSVYAVADGYISRIKIEPGGFGRALYITHPNGYTTLYAHLNNFASRIEAYVKQQQYTLETWRLQLELDPGQLPVRKGDFIAFSGNTGGSQAPHLHFEIRRTEDDVNLNPLLFGLPLKDNVKPSMLRLAVYDRTRSVYEQAPRIFPVKGGAGGYTTSSALIRVSSPMISLAFTGYDTHSGSSNLNGIYEGALYVNDQLVESFKMDNISYNGTRYLNAHIDYRYKTLGGAYLQHLSELPGYLHSIYLKGNGAGVLDISDGEVYNIRVEARDTEGNTSAIRTRIQYSYAAQPVNNASGKMFYPLMLDGYETERCEFYIGEKCLYDSVHIRYSHTVSSNPDVVSEVHSIGANFIPLQDSFLVRIRPTVLSEADPLHTVMQWTSGGKSATRKVQWQGEWASARFRDFGNFQLVTDTTAPVVKMSFADGANLSKASRIVFSLSDNLPGIKNVRAELDGKWLRCTNDKGVSFIYVFDEKCPAGAHILEIFAEDEAGNKVSRKFGFIR